jgi:hypothetical protein
MRQSSNGSEKKARLVGALQATRNAIELTLNNIRVVTNHWQECTDIASTLVNTVEAMMGDKAPRRRATAAVA